MLTKVKLKQNLMWVYFNIGSNKQKFNVMMLD
jgi:hypothetical protein